MFRLSKMERRNEECERVRSEESIENLERQLRQKLVLLESAVARIASTKLQLKENADLVAFQELFTSPSSYS